MEEKCERIRSGHSDRKAMCNAIAGRAASALPRDGALNFIVRNVSSAHALTRLSFAPRLPFTALRRAEIIDYSIPKKL